MGAHSTLIVTMTILATRAAAPLTTATPIGSDVGSTCPSVNHTGDSLSAALSTQWSPRKKSASK